MRTFNVNERLTMSKMQLYNDLARNEQIVLVFDNTKTINTEIFSCASDNILFSIKGGLSPSKKKYNSHYYQKRTFYSRDELVEIIKKFEKIERKLNPMWSDLEKVMFIYKSLCEFLEYSENNYNNRDASRNLLGLITGKSVCAGCSMIFKEAMDRIGVECIYQNKQGDHSWNVVKIGEFYYAIELTWELAYKKNNTCTFRYFCVQNHNYFYSHKQHDITMEKEEKEYNLKVMSVDDLSDALNNILKSKIILGELQKNVGIEKINIEDKEITIVNGSPLYSYVDDTKFIRKDNTEFLLIPTGRYDKGVYEYIYFECNKQNGMYKSSKLYSDIYFLDCTLEDREFIANDLLSLRRINDKISNFNGYVGYIKSGDNIKYANANFEENEIYKYR